MGGESSDGGGEREGGKAKTRFVDRIPPPMRHHTCTYRVSVHNMFQILPH